jgi:hypothetical protein
MFPNPRRRDAINTRQRGHYQAMARKRLNRTRRFIIAHPAFPETAVPPPAD